MGDEDLGILLKNGHHRSDRHAFLQHVEGNETVRTNAEIGGTAGKQLGNIDAGATLHNLDIETAGLVEAEGLSLIEAAMLGLRLPVGDERDVRRRLYGAHT